MIERVDGYMDAEAVAAAYFYGVRKWFPVERQALRYLRGRVLDVGAGAGRVALELQHRGREVVAIDVSPLATAPRAAVAAERRCCRSNTSPTRWARSTRSSSS